MAPTGRKRRLLVFVTLALVLLLVILPLTLEWVLNLAPVKTRAATLIETRTGVKLEPEHLFIQLIPSLRVGLKDQEVSFGDVAQIKIKALNVDLDYLDLFSGTPTLSEIDLQSPVLILRDAPETADSTESQADAQEAATPVLDFPKKAIAQLFALFPESQTQLLLNFEHADSPYFKDLTGRLLLYRDNEQLLLNAAFKELDLNKENLPKGTLPDVVPLDGISTYQGHVIARLDAQGTLKSHLRLYKVKMASSADLPKPVSTPEVQLNITLAPDRQEISVPPFNLNYPDARVAFDFSRIPGKKVSIVFSGPRVNLAQGGEACLKFAGWVTVIQHLFDILRQGTAKDVTVAFSGTDLSNVWDPTRMVIKGQVENATVKIPATELFARKVQGRADMADGVIHIQVPEGMVEGSRIATQGLDIDLVNYFDFPFGGQFNLDVDLKTLPQALIKVLPDTVLAEEMARIRSAHGRVQAGLILEQKHNQALEVTVTAPHFHGEFSYDRIPYPVVVEAGDFHLKDDDLTLTDFAGHLNGNAFSGVTGKIRFLGQGPMQVSAKEVMLRIEDFLPWAQTNPAIREQLLPVTQARGELRLNHLQIKGQALDPWNWNYRFKGNAQGVTADLNQISPTLKNLSGGFHLANDRAELTQIQGQLHDLSWAQPHLSPDLTQSLPMPLALSKMDLASTPDGARLKGHFKFPTQVDLYLNLEGPTMAGLQPREIAVQDNESQARIQVNPPAQSPMLAFTGNLSLSTLEKMLLPDSPYEKKIHAFSHQDPIRLYTDKQGTIHLTAGRLNLDSWLEESKAAEKEEEADTSVSAARPLFNDQEIRVEIDSLTYKKRNYTGVKGRILFQNQGVQFIIESANLCGLDITGNVAIYGPAKQKRTRVNIKIQSKPESPIEPLAQCLMPGTRLIDGNYTLSCTLTGDGPSNRITHHLTGEIKFLGKNGRIYKMTPLSRLLSVLNLLNMPDLRQKGFAYRSMLAQGTLKNGRIELDKAFIDAENMFIVFKGYIDPFQWQLDVNSMVSPLKAIDTIIEKIPIVSTLLNDRLVSFPARIKGDISDPKITPLHPEAVGAGFKNLVEDILTAPGRIIKETF